LVAHQISDSTKSIAERKARCADWSFFRQQGFSIHAVTSPKPLFKKIAEFGITSKSVAKNGQ
jgi:hypothetical protein